MATSRAPSRTLESSILVVSLLHLMNDDEADFLPDTFSYHSIFYVAYWTCVISLVKQCFDFWISLHFVLCKISDISIVVFITVFNVWIIIMTGRNCEIFLMKIGELIFFRKIRPYFPVMSIMQQLSTREQKCVCDSVLEVLLRNKFTQQPIQYLSSLAKYFVIFQPASSHECISTCFSLLNSFENINNYNRKIWQFDSASNSNSQLQNWYVCGGNEMDIVDNMT